MLYNRDYVNSREQLTTNSRAMTEGESEKEDQSLSSSSIDWKTPSFVNIKSRELHLFRVLNWEEYKGKIVLARIITDPF